MGIRTDETLLNVPAKGTIAKSVGATIVHHTTGRSMIALSRPRAGTASEAPSQEDLDQLLVGKCPWHMDANHSVRSAAYSPIAWSTATTPNDPAAMTAKGRVAEEAPWGAHAVITRLGGRMKNGSKIPQGTSNKKIGSLTSSAVALAPRRVGVD